MVVPFSMPVRRDRSDKTQHLSVMIDGSTIPFYDPS